MDQRSFHNLIIPGWVIFELGLNYSELRVYCIILGFSQGGNGWFYGNRQYLADWCGISKVNNVSRILRGLQDKGLLRKRSELELGDNGRTRKVVRYQAVEPPFLRTQN